MPTSFQNMATLTYTGGTVNSNIVTGELREVLTAAKTAVRENYEPGGTVTYVVSLTNSGVTPLTGHFRQPGRLRLWRSDPVSAGLFAGQRSVLCERRAASRSGRQRRTAHDRHRHHGPCRGQHPCDL